MKTIWQKIGMLVLNVIFLTLASNSWGEEKIYVLSYSGGTFFHELVRDRMKVVYERAGLKVKFEDLPHNRALMSANDGTTDGDVGRIASTVEKFPNLVRLKVKVMDMNGSVYTTRDEITAYDDALLTKYRIGYVLGVRWTEEKMKGLEATVVQDYPALFDLLLNGRVDMILTTEESADPIIKSLGDKAAHIRKLQPFAYTAPIYHLLNKKNEDIIPRLEEALTALQKEGYWKD